MKQHSRGGVGLLALLLALAVSACTDSGVDIAENALAPPHFSSHAGVTLWATGAGFVNLQPPSLTHRHRFNFVVQEVGGPPGLVETNLDYWDMHIPAAGFHITGSGPWAIARKSGSNVYLQGSATNNPLGPGAPGPAPRFICVWIEDGASTGTPDRFYLRDNGGTPPPPPPPPPPVLDDGYSSGPGTYAPELACPQDLSVPGFTPALPPATGTDQTTLAPGSIRVY